MVLVVDDDSDARCTLVSSLSNAGYRCLATDNVETASWYLRRVAPDVTVVEVGDDRERLRFATFLANQPAAGAVVLMRALHTASSWPRRFASPVLHACDPRDVVAAVAAARRAQPEAAC